MYCLSPRQATKLALRYFASMSAQRAALYADVSTSSPAADAELGDSIEDKLMNANPILEAMGNAKTTRNDNSSRFGKWLSLQLNDRGLISGGR
jgi:myosin-5